MTNSSRACNAPRGEPASPLYAWRAPSFDFTVASVRIRCIQVMEGLQALGEKVEKFTAGREKSYTAVVFSKAYSDADIDLAVTLREQSVLVIFDICDNHVYWESSSPALQKRFQRLERMTRVADRIVCSTDSLEEELRKAFPFASEKTVVIPDMIDDHASQADYKGGGSYLERLSDIRIRRFLFSNRDALKLVWFGNHGVGHAKSGMSDLSRLRSDLERYQAGGGVALTVISNSFRKYLKVTQDWKIKTCYVPWSAGFFRHWLTLHDAAVIPISRNPFTVVKTNNRPATALLAGLGVIADSIPSYEELRPYIWLDEWSAGLSSYGASMNTEISRIAAGKDFLLERYSSRAVSLRWKVVLNESVTQNYR